jgi:hypothetical protein
LAPGGFYRQNRTPAISLQDGAMSKLGQSRPGQTNGKSGYVRQAAESGRDGSLHQRGDIRVPSRQNDPGCRFAHPGYTCYKANISAIRNAAAMARGEAI